ncbi:hypothetical protein AX14_007614 [Amanita brunnescens Koide BX004]|nr:hypothetical protein AX14_007614 [Amanita brunnescens Koide BX004]
MSALPLSNKHIVSGFPANHFRTFKDVSFRVLTVAAIMYASLYGLRQLFARPYSFNMFGLKNCHSMNANFSTMAKLPTHYALPSGDKIPTVGLGVWRSARKDVGEAVKVALKAGYRHIDDAWIYGNEAEVGQAIKESDVPRSDIWLTSKLWNTFHDPKDIERVLDESLVRLGTNYLDLYLIHWPVAFKDDGGIDFDLTENPYPTWQKLEELVEKGKIRNIGVSNFNIRRLTNLTSNALKIKPAVNQVEINFWFPQPELIEWSKENNILLEAYSPLGSAERVRKSLSVPEVREISTELGITPAQVIISWLVQRGTVVLPKSVTPSRIEENIQIVALPEAVFKKLEKAATSHKPQRGSNPSKKWGVEIFN